MRSTGRARRVLTGPLIVALALGAGSMTVPTARAAFKAPPETHIIKWDYPPKFNNVTINVVGDAGHNLLPYEFWKDHFPKAGISIKIIEVPFEGVYEKEKTEFVAGSGAFDVVTFYPAYIGDFASNGYLEPLDEYMAKQPASVWNPHQEDVLPPFRELYNKWGGKTYALTIDGDAHLLIYRKDLFSDPGEKAAFKAKYGKDLQPPQTWGDWLQIGSFFTRKKGQKLAGKTLDRDFYGSAEFAKRGFSFAWFVDRWAASGELYFDNNMNPQINSAAAVTALQNFVDSLKNAPPDVRAYGYDELRDALLKGNVAMVVQWTDVPKKGADPSQSQVVGKLDYGRVPGLLINGVVVHRAMMPVGRVVAVAASSKNKLAAYCLHGAYRAGCEPGRALHASGGVLGLQDQGGGRGVSGPCQGGAGRRVSRDLHPGRRPVRGCARPAREQGPGRSGNSEAGPRRGGEGMERDHRPARAAEADPALDAGPAEL